MIENEENLDSLLEDSDTAFQFIEGIFQYEIEVTRKYQHN